MQLSDFLSPVNEHIFSTIQESSPKTLVNVTDIFVKHMPDLTGVTIAIVGVQEDRIKPEYKGCETSPDEVRKHFYQLAQPKYDIRMVDLGNIEAGSTVNDTLFALNAVLQYLHERKIITIILGGTQELAYAQYTSYQGLNHAVNAAVTDARIDLKQHESDHNQTSFLYKMIAHQPNYLFNIVHLANQNYFIEQESLDSFEKMNFDIVRLGNVRNKPQETEPLLRNANMFVMSMNSIRAADCPASTDANPNGLFGEEACQIIRYAGMGNELTTIGFYDLNTSKDIDGRSAKLVSQMVWYFIDGVYARTNDYPSVESSDYLIYRSTFKNSNHEIVFYKNTTTNRWWMEVPYPKERSNQKGLFMVPCSYADYQLAQTDEIPDRWMKAYQKLL
jgi:arginase family enzyme